MNSKLSDADSLSRVAEALAEVVSHSVRLFEATNQLEEAYADVDDPINPRSFFVPTTRAGLALRKAATDDYASANKRFVRQEAINAVLKLRASVDAAIQVVPSVAHRMNGAGDSAEKRWTNRTIDQLLTLLDAILLGHTRDAFPSALPMIREGVPQAIREAGSRVGERMEEVKVEVLAVGGTLPGRAKPTVKPTAQPTAGNGEAAPVATYASAAIDNVRERIEEVKKHRSRVAAAIREYLRFLDTLDDAPCGGRMCPADRPTLETRWGDVCETVNEYRRWLLALAPADAHGNLQFENFQGPEREDYDVLTGAIFASSMDRRMADGTPWLDAVARSATPPRHAYTVVGPDKMRKLRAIAERLAPDAAAIDQVAIDRAAELAAERAAEKVARVFGGGENNGRAKSSLEGADSGAKRDSSTCESARPPGRTQPGVSEDWRSPIREVVGLVDVLLNRIRVSGLVLDTYSRRWLIEFGDRLKPARLAALAALDKAVATGELSSERANLAKKVLSGYILTKWHRQSDGGISPIAQSREVDATDVDRLERDFATMRRDLLGQGREREAEAVIAAANKPNALTSDHAIQALLEASIAAVDTLSKVHDERMARVEQAVKSISVAEPKALAGPARTEVVLWEGAAHTDRNIRLARTRSAYLEAHGNVVAALAALKQAGNAIGKSTFYDHLTELDNACPGWRANVLVSGVSGNPDNCVRVRKREKPRAKLR